MLWMLAVLVVIAMMGTMSSRMDEHGLRRMWLGTLLMTSIGGAVLLVAEVTGSLGLFYLSALMLAIGVPLLLVLTAALCHGRKAAV